MRNLSRDNKTTGTHRNRKNPDMDSIGLPVSAGWQVATAMFAVAGAAVLLLAAAGSDVTREASVFVYGVAGLVIAPVWLLGIRWNVGERWLHVPVVLGFVILYGAFLNVDANLASFVVLALFPIVPPAYVFRPIRGIPHVVIGTGLIVALMASSSAMTGGWTHSIVLVLVIATVAAMVALSQRNLRKAVALSRSLSERDPLTGLANVRRLRRRIGEEILRAQRRKSSIALFAIDLDNFKQVNDQFSHTLGDAVLNSTAEAISSQLDGTDLAARRGGDEFSILVSHEGTRDLDGLARRTADAIAEIRRTICPEISPTASVGYAEWVDGESADSLLQRADDALHAAKLEAHPERKAAERLANAQARATIGHPALTPAAPTVTPIDNEPDSVPEATGALNDVVATAHNKAVSGKRPDEVRDGWGFAAVMTACGAVGLIVNYLTGIEPELRGSSELILGAVGLIAAGGYGLAQRAQLSGRFYVAVPLLMFGLISLVTLSGHESRASLVDLFLLPIFFAAFFVPWRQALPMLVVGLSLFGWFLASVDGPDTLTRLVLTSTVAVVVGAFISTNCLRSEYFARENIAQTGIDPLTGLANLRRLRARLADEMASAERHDVQVAVMAIDLDQFKQVNDLYSHTLGDELLVAVAEAIDGCARADELAARRGGDEFAIISVHTEPVQLEPLTDRVSAAITDARTKVCAAVQPTASIGVVIWEPGETIDELLERADLALHEAKLASRERSSQAA